MVKRQRLVKLENTQKWRTGSGDTAAAHDDINIHGKLTAC